MRALQVANGTLVHATELVVGREHFEGPLMVGDYVLIRLPEREGQRVLQSVFKIVGAAGDVAPERETAEGGGSSSKDEQELIAPGIFSCSHAHTQMHR